MEVVKPDRFHMKGSAAGGQVFELIMIGSDNYVYAAGKWTKMTANLIPLSPFLSSDPQKILGQINTSAQAKGSVTKGGIDQIDGASCQEWVWTPTDTSQTGGSMCIGVSNSLPVQFKTTDGSVVATYTDWNAPISIQPPAM